MINYHMSGNIILFILLILYMSLYLNPNFFFLLSFSHKNTLSDVLSKKIRHPLKKSYITDFMETVY